MHNVELWRNGGGNAATLQPVFLQFLAELDILESFVCWLIDEIKM